MAQGYYSSIEAVPVGLVGLDPLALDNRCLLGFQSCVCVLDASTLESEGMHSVCP